MKPRQRQEAILAYLQKNGKTTISDLIEHFKATGTTIRKDLTEMEKRSEVIRIHGGVILSHEEGDQPIDHKTHINSDRKRRIAESAVQLVNDGDSLILDTGSTVLQMVRHLKPFNNITVMTNSLHIVNALMELDGDQTILMPGGTLRKSQLHFMEGLPSQHSALLTLISYLLAPMALIWIWGSPPLMKFMPSAHRCARLLTRLLC